MQAGYDVSESKENHLLKQKNILLWSARLEGSGGGEEAAVVLIRNLQRPVSVSVCDRWADARAVIRSETARKHTDEEARGGKGPPVRYLRQGGARLLAGVPTGAEGWGGMDGGRHGWRRRLLME